MAKIVERGQEGAEISAKWVLIHYQVVLVRFSYIILYVTFVQEKRMRSKKCKYLYLCRKVALFVRQKSLAL